MDYQGLSVVFRSVLVTVPSAPSVTVFSFDSTVPSLLTLVLSVCEIVRSHPVRRDNPKAEIAAKVTSLVFFKYFIRET